MIKTIIEKNSIEPYIIKVEDPNDVPVAVSVQDISAYVASNKLVLEHFLSKYIKARESYDPDSYKYDYGSVVAAMSSPEVYAAFKGVYLNDKDLSPIKKIGQFGRIEVNIQQVVARENANAFIFRIAKNIYSYNNLTDTQFYQITVNYRFDTSNMSYAASMVNPLGIKVFKYEVLSEKNINNS
jgi:type IV secretion system protein VirB8